MSGSWIVHKKPSKFKGALAFNKADQDSIANPKNKSIVPMRGINLNWGLAEGSLIRKVEDIFKPAEPKELDKRGEEYREQRKKELADRVKDTKKKFKGGTRVWYPGEWGWAKGIVADVQYMLTAGTEGVFVLVKSRQNKSGEWHLPEQLRLPGSGPGFEDWTR
jgi:hypothetical protein